MARWRPDILAGFQLRQPSIGFLMRQMQAGPTILFPGADGILSQGLPLLLALDILRDGFPHDPVRTASTDFRELPGTPFQGIIELMDVTAAMALLSAKAIPYGKLSYLHDPIPPANNHSVGRSRNADPPISLSKLDFV